MGKMKVTVTELAAYVGKSERTIHRWLASGQLPHKRLPGGLVEVDDSLVIGPIDEQESTILTRLARIEQKLDDLAAIVGAMSQIDRAPAPRHTPVSRDIANQGELPPGLMPWREYCELKGYATSTVKRAIDRGEIPVHRGKWKKGKVYILALIDEEGKRAIDRLYGKSES